MALPPIRPTTRVAPEFRASSLEIRTILYKHGHPMMRLQLRYSHTSASRTHFMRPYKRAWYTGGARIRARVIARSIGSFSER
jgi:hypothetical protein